LRSAGTVHLAQRLSYFLLSNQYALSVILGRNLSTPKALKRHEDHIVAVVLGYLRRGG
jgi:hypothetical protein